MYTNPLKRICRIRIRVVTSKRQDEAFASSKFLPEIKKQNTFCWQNNPQLNKIDFSQEIPHEKCVWKRFIASRFQNCLEGMPAEPTCKILPRLWQSSGYGPAVMWILYCEHFKLFLNSKGNPHCAPIRKIRWEGYCSESFCFKFLFFIICFLKLIFITSTYFRGHILK